MERRSDIAGSEVSRHHARPIFSSVAFLRRSLGLTANTVSHHRVSTNDLAVNSAAGKDPFRYIVAACAANGLVFIIPNTSPFVIGGLIEGASMTPERAGLILTAELIAMGVGAFCVAPLVSVTRRHRLAIVGALLMVVANAAAMNTLVGGVSVLLIVRIIAGAGAGLLLAAANAAIAASASPPRLYGVAFMVGWGVAALLGPVMAFAVGRFSYVGVYGVWMGLALACLPLLGGLGARMPPGTSQTHVPDRAFLVAAVHIAGVVLVGLSMMAYFAFVERLAQRVGFTLEDVGILFAALSISGALGAGLAGLLGARIGLVAPLLGGTILHAFAIILAVETGSRWLFVGGAMAEGFTYMYILAYQLAVAATLDVNGRWAAATSGAMIGSTGLGPYVGGALITAYGFSSLSWLMVATTLTAVAAFAWVGARLKSGRDVALAQE